jgi:hypothetical protein
MARSRLTTMSRDQLDDGDVTIRVHYSSINYKDALAATGAGKIVRRFPCVGGRGALGWRGGQRRGPDPGLGPRHNEAGRNRRQHRQRGAHRARDHGLPIHPAWRRAAGDRLRLPDVSDAGTCLGGLAGDLKPRFLRDVTRVVDLDSLPGCFDDFNAGRVKGRTVVRIVA